MTAAAGPSDPARSRAWTDAEARALDQIRQGHVVDGIPLIAVSPANPTWQGTAIGTAAARTVVTEHPPVARKAMVVSQGCDLVRTTFPWATVVPVYDIETFLGTSQRSAARSGQTRYLVPITAQWAPTGLWVADLRFEIPVDKALLATLTPEEGFADEAGYADLAARLAESRQRAAVPDPCLNHVAKPLFDAVRDRQADSVDPNDGVREIRVICNDPVAPTTVHLLVVPEQGHQPNADEWNTIFDLVHPKATAAGIALTGPEIAGLDELTATDYLTSAPIADTASS